MGAELARAHGFQVEELPTAPSHETTAVDTERAATELLGRNLDLLLFAGGDGTARDILAVVGTATPTLGIPSGVKMHSGVFAASPRTAGLLAGEFLNSYRGSNHDKRQSASRSTVRAEVVDRQAGADGAPGPVTLFGEMLVPRAPTRMLTAKSQGDRADRALEALQAAIVEEMDDGTLYILGPGSTVGGIRRRLGLPNRPLAIAAVRGRVLVEDDVNEERLLELVSRVAHVTLIVSVIGGQGSLLGRGNQELSASVIRKVGHQNLQVIASMDKIARIAPPRLYVDTGDPTLDDALTGYRPVRVGPRQSVMVEVRS
jgi:predicted polyphosphate/ATP-dependent NAD kinase